MQSVCGGSFILIKEHLEFVYRCSHKAGSLCDTFRSHYNRLISWKLKIFRRKQFPRRVGRGITRAYWMRNLSFLRLIRLSCTWQSFCPRHSGYNGNILWASHFSRGSRIIDPNFDKSFDLLLFESPEGETIIAFRSPHLKPRLDFPNVNYAPRWDED